MSSRVLEPADLGALQPAHGLWNLYAPERAALRFQAEDVASAALAVSRSGQLEGEVYNVATGVACSTSDLAHKVAAAMDLDPTLEYTGRVRAGDPDRWQADISRLQALGFSPAVELDEGIRRTVAWFREDS